jgi:hypothetical protein
MLTRCGRAVNLASALAPSLAFGELAPATAERIRQTRPWHCLRSHPFAFPCSVETLLSGVAHVAGLRLSKALIIFTTSFISQNRLGCRPPCRGSSLAFGGCGRSCNRRRKCSAILSANVEHGDPLVTASAPRCGPLHVRFFRPTRSMRSTD